MFHTQSHVSQGCGHAEGGRLCLHIKKIHELFPLCEHTLHILINFTVNGGKKKGLGFTGNAENASPQGSPSHAGYQSSQKDHYPWPAHIHCTSPSPSQLARHSTGLLNGPSSLLSLPCCDLEETLSNPGCPRRTEPSRGILAEVKLPIRW